MEKIMYWARAAVLVPVICCFIAVEFVIKLVWGILYFIFSPITRKLPKAAKKYGYTFKLDQDYYPITDWITRAWSLNID